MTSFTLGCSAVLISLGFFCGFRGVISDDPKLSAMSAFIVGCGVFMWSVVTT